MSRFQLPKMNLNNYLPLRHPCGSHGYQLVIIYIAKFANLRMVLWENCELFHSLLGVMSIWCCVLRVTKYFLRQWTCRKVVNRHLFFYLPDDFTSIAILAYVICSRDQRTQVVTCMVYDIYGLVSAIGVTVRRTMSTWGEFYIHQCWEY